ncbi:TetR/AcrR family transcriptional regulator [Glutamicibacter mishrai]|uniref:TetR/AcrR family transcriptional regulator n=1 Tax=Glutamicibacter mishrai TaxID=1775880 RepID=A0A6H0SNK6_9MICC|nr:TetR/AcrR family transcriptional regulator [Glutamicibacter mishrai]QIV87567.1 TetR/AcrR family transcriptional regulator [Glutamicibacter mishrai]
MTTPASQRQRVRATDSKERLFEAAMTLLGNRAPEAVSVDQIAAAAGVSKGTVYYNYGSKDQLISQILDFGANKLMDELSRVAAGPDPYAALKHMVEFAMDFVASYPAFVQLWMQEQLHADLATTTTLHSRVTDLLLQVLERLAHLDEADKLPVATTIFGAALFTARMRATWREDLARDQVINAVMLTVDGLLATRPPATG